jgi:hypothetical protein
MAVAYSSTQRAVTSNAAHEGEYLTIQTTQAARSRSDLGKVSKDRYLLPIIAVVRRRRKSPTGIQENVNVDAAQR